MTEHWIWLAERPGLGPVRAGKLLRAFGSAEAIWAMDEAALSRAGITGKALSVLSDKDLRRAEETRNECRARGIRMLCPADEDYPERLRQLSDAPLILYCLGRLPDLSGRPSIGLVGSRAANHWGLETALRLGWQIAGCGGAVVTGMALGIDGAAARGALDRGGPVIGVLGGGVDVVYPKENRDLFERIVTHGCLLSEYPPGSAPIARQFPARNRIISALSDGVVVVQAAERSGALITARWAADQGRDVFAVPGPAGDALSRGSNQLLRDGAILSECGWDVMREYEYRYPNAVREYHGRPRAAAADRAAPSTGGTAERHPAGKAEMAPIPKKPAGSNTDSIPAEPARKAKLSGLSPEQERIVAALSGGALQLDALIAAVDLPAGQVLSQITLLEVRRIVTRAPGKIYSLQSFNSI